MPGRTRRVLFLCTANSLPMTAHWGVEDAAAFAGPAMARRRVFRRVSFELEGRIEAFAGLPIDALDRPSLQCRLDAIVRGNEGV
jgi:arsenate reductase